MNAAVKARLQERRAAESLRTHRAEAARRGLRELSDGEIAGALAERLKGRAHPRWPKRRGELHVFMPFYLENWEYVLPLSMQAFGKVTVFDWRERGYDQRSKDWVRRRDEMNAEMLAEFRRANRVQPVDAVVGYLSGMNTAPEILLEMAKSGAAIFNFCYDDKLQMPGGKIGGRDSSPAAIASAVDLNLTNAPDSVIKYFVHGGLAIFCPPGAQPEVHAPQPGEFEYDVSFVGGKYGWRPRLIAQLERRGVKVNCFGNGWPNGAVTDAEMLRIWSHSRINLGMAGVGHSQKLRCIKGRDFEVPMCGGLYVTQESADIHRVYEVGREIVTYEGVEDCARKIKALLAEPKRAERIRGAGHERARRCHTWEARWERVFGLAGISE